MTIDFEIEETTNGSPERIVVYGPPGIGKTTMVFGAPKIIFLDLDWGANKIPGLQRNKKPILSLADFKNAVGWLRNGKHDYKSFGFDTLDALEALIHKNLCETDGVDSIEEAKKGWGKGPTAAMEQMREVMASVNDICTNRDMHFVGTAHQKLSNMKNPSGYDYQRHDLRLHDKATPIVLAAVDYMLFATRKVIVSDKEFGGERARAIEMKERILRTTEGPAYIAKSRAKIPDPIPLSWHDFVCHLAVAGWPRLLRETVVDNARRTGNAETLKKAEGMVRENPDVGTLAAANKRLIDILYPSASAPNGVASASSGGEPTKASEASKAPAPH